MKRITQGLFAFLLLATACNKSNDGSGSDSGNETFAPLIPASTGWERVSVIPYQQLISGFAGQNKMTPYDMTSVGSNITLIYSEDYKMYGVDGHNIMKLMLTNGTVDAKGKAVKLNYDRGGNATQVHRFIPGSFTTISCRFLNNECLLYDEAGGPNAGQNFGSINALPTVRWYSDGTILASMNDGPHSSASWVYKYPAAGNFKYVINAWNGDPTSNLLSSSMKLSDDKVYDLVFSKQNETMYFSVIRNLNQPQTGNSANYETICRNTVPELDGSKSYSILSSDVQGEAQTILLGEVAYDGNPRITGLVAFRWRKGATTLEKLYSVANVPIETGKTLLTLTTNTSFANEVRFTPDGSAYFLREYSSSQGNASAYTVLDIINKDGIKEIGKIEAVAMEKIKRTQFAIHCCRYLNGTYYAIVHPTEEYEYDANTPEFRMELVKINP